MEEQLEEELRFHLDQHENSLMARQRSPAQARREARLALGGPEQVDVYTPLGQSTDPLPLSPL